MVQAADFGKLHDLPRGGDRDRPDVGGVLVEREMGARLMIVDEVTGQDAVEVSLVEDEHVIQALTPDRAEEPLCERVLPRTLRRRENLLDPEAFHAAPELLAIDAVTIAQKIGGRGLLREGRRRAAEQSRRRREAR
jgi:hypothetical protein